MTIATALTAGIGIGILVDGPGLPPASAPTPSPPSYSAPAVSPAPSVLPAAGPSTARTQGIAAALARPLTARALGARVGVAVLGADGTVLLDRGSSVPHTPASTAKLLTAAAALEVLGPQTRLATRVVALPVRSATPNAGPLDVVLVGAGDATLAGGRPTAQPHPSGDSSAYARLDVLADRVATGLRTTAPGRPVRLHIDDTAFTQPVSPDWPAGYITSGVVAPVHALSLDQGRVRSGRDPRVADPALTAGLGLAALLRTRGVDVLSAVTRTTAPEAATELARVESPPVADLVERMLTQSDNDVAEALARLVAAAGTGPTTSRGAGAAVLGAVRALGVPVSGASLLDGSGLARGSRVPPVTLVRTLAAAAAADHPELRALLSGLPVSGATGTLAGRYTRAGPDRLARGEVRAKTGTLTGVSSLAGLAQGRDGGLVVFAFMADGVPATGTLEARAALDAAAAALVACGCD